ncbi:hypothetical protein [Pseudonocardia sp. HH130630-07]|uniref:hypothetical protein n=1 Tax=Pseudonocardia sp. HH130630-07 TaxID=1690815 RepID=UPI0012EA3CFC|nr:hypothetical protein [Pseudonocardia sp. HH130630-07]
MRPERNTWGVAGSAVVGWRAVLPAGADGGRAMTRTVLAVGEASGVYRVRSVPAIGFDRDAHGPLAGFLDAHPHLDGGAALFDHRHHVSVRLAWTAAGGTVVEDDVPDLRAAGGPMVPVLEVDGIARPDGSAELTVVSRSDIWLPWAVPDPVRDIDDYDDPADNTALAARNAPRLAGLLARLRAVVARCRGRWELDPEQTLRGVRFQVDDAGVRLDAPRPRVVAEEGWVDGDRPDAVFRVLRTAAARHRLHVHDPRHEVVVRLLVTTPGHELQTGDPDRVLRLLRRPRDPGNALTTADLAGVDRIEIDNETGRVSVRADRIHVPGTGPSG